MKTTCLFLLGLAFCWGLFSCTAQQPKPEEVIEIINRVNNYWQETHPQHGRSFWDNAAYHTGNMEVFFLTGNPECYAYSEAWAEHNEWKGAKSDNKEEWKYSYGESDDYVLFGDYQICFQTYADLYTVKPDSGKIARAREVMEYQMSTDKNDYWWWADGLYMVMPVMTKMYKLTGNPLYLEKLHEYWTYANSIMYDAEEGLYYRDGKYIYPKHKSVNGKKDFWARGDGWVLAALAKVLKDLPETDQYRQEYIDRFQTMAKSVAACAARKSFSKSARLAMLGKLIANTFQEALILLRLFLDRGLRRSKTLLIFSKFKLIGKLKRNPLNFLVKKTYLQAFLQQLRQQSYYDYQ